MGLMEVLKGMQHGPHGQPPPSSGSSSTGTGMSPITMAILGLLAYKAMKSFGGEQGAAPSPAGQAPAPPAGGNVRVATTDDAGGGLGDLLRGGLGGLLAGGAAAGSILSGGLNDLLKQLQQSGLHEETKSWVGTGPNKTIAPDDLAKALGADQINAMMEHSGLSRDELLEALSQHLPGVIDQLTPRGQVPRKIPM
jgi:uncharacterized protein YidB (DUF937 family)